MSCLFKRNLWHHWLCWTKSQLNTSLFHSVCAPETPWHLRVFISLCKFLGISVLCLTRGRWYTPSGTSKSGDSAKPECFQRLTQPLNFCTSVTNAVLCFSLSFPFIPFHTLLLLLSASPSSSVLSARFAELWWRHTTGRGQRRAQCISLTLLLSRMCCPEQFPVSLTAPLMSPLQPFPLFTFKSETSALPHLFAVSCRQGICFFSLTGAALAPNLSSGLM